MLSMLIARIEKIQESTISSIGRSPFEIRHQIDRDAKNDLALFGEAAISAETLEAIVPEKHYGDLDRLAGQYQAVEKTRYDRAPFLHRFINLRALCQDFFVNEIGLKELDISLFSLPLSQVNGVSVLLDNNQRVVFLNEGLLFFAPQMLLAFKDVAALKNKYDLLERDPAKHSDIETQLNTLLNNQLAYFFEQTLIAIGGQYSPIELLEMDSNWHRHAFENWKFAETLRKQLKGHDYQEVSETKQAFWATRGFYLLITAHEYSHFYRQHHSARDEDIKIKPLNEARKDLHEVRAYFRNPIMPMELVRSEHYSTIQPTETEADADALRCVKKYCQDNQLNEQDTQMVVLGALSAFAIMEYIERIALTVNGGPQHCETVRIMPYVARNIMSGSEHPCPLSRPYLAMETEYWKNDASSFKENVQKLWKDMEFTVDWMWSIFSPQIHQSLVSSNMEIRSLQNRSELFDHYDAVGCFDLDNVSHLKA